MAPVACLSFCINIAYGLRLTAYGLRHLDRSLGGIRCLNTECIPLFYSSISILYYLSPSTTRADISMLAHSFVKYFKYYSGVYSINFVFKLTAYYCFKRQAY